MNKLSFVTNATRSDSIRLNHFLSAALETFGNYISELIVVIDNLPESGRISGLHNDLGAGSLNIDELAMQINDPRVRFVDLDYDQANRISQKWFAKDHIIRCQAGTPIFAFLFGIEQCSSDNIFRSDCDIVFLDRGFIQHSINLLADFDVIQSPFLKDEVIPFSSRSFFINRKSIETCLPLQMKYLDPVRIIHRWIRGKPIYMALEQTFEYNIERGKIKECYCPTQYGYSMHIPVRSDFINIDHVIDRFNKGDIPIAQLQSQHNYIKSAW